MSAPTLRIGLRENKVRFTPGEVIQGAALWEMSEAPESAEIRLLWNTRGKGTEDGEVVETVAFDAPQAGDTRSFTVTLPKAPYSFDGQLIALMWSLELVLEPGNHFVRETIILGPDANEVTLPRIEQPAAKGAAKFIKSK